MHARSRSRTIIAAAFLVVLFHPAGAQPRRAMTIDDALDLVQVSAPRISPDGRHVLYTKSELAKWKDNKRTQTIWIVDADGSNGRQFLSSDKDRNPAWAPDGKHVAFLSTRDAATEKESESSNGIGAQIWVIPTDGGEATKLTTHRGNIKSFDWMKDSSAIVFAAERGQSDAEKAERKAGDDAIYVDEAANGQERGVFSELWRVSIADKSERQITHDDHLLIENLRVSPDGSKVAVVYRRENGRNGQFHAEVATVDSATGGLTTLTHNNTPEANVQWSPEGKMLSYLAPSDTTWDLAEDKLWLIPSEGGQPRKLTATFNGDIGQYSWSSDGQSIVFGAAVRARGAGYRVNIATGVVSPITPPGDWAGRVESVSADGRRGAAVISRPDRPTDVHVIDLATGAATAVTHVNPRDG